MDELFDGTVTRSALVRELEARLARSGRSRWRSLLEIGIGVEMRLWLARDYLVGSRWAAMLVGVKAGVLILLVQTVVHQFTADVSTRELGVILVTGVVAAFGAFWWSVNPALDTCHAIASDLKNRPTHSRAPQVSGDRQAHRESRTDSGR